MNEMHVYAKEVSTLPVDGETVDVVLEGVELGNVLQNFNTRLILDELDYSDIVDYVTARQREDGLD